METGKILKISVEVEKAKETFSFLPRRCLCSGKQLLFKKAYCVVTFIDPLHGPIIRQHYWFSANSYFMLLIKGD